MQPNAQAYLRKAVGIIGEHIFILAIPLVIGLFFHFPRPPEQPADFGFIFPVIFLIIAYPLVYGQYAEIALNHKQDSYLRIFERHWLNYYSVSLVAAVPFLLLSLWESGAGGEAALFKMPLAIMTDALFIYVFPLVFILQRRLPSISLGIRCLLGNLRFSFPLILVASAPSILGLSLDFPFQDHGFFYHYLFFCLSLYCDALVFVAATLVLKEKLLDG